MDWYEARITIVGRRSAHNSLNDKLDIARWEFLKEHIDRFLEGHAEDYEHIVESITLYTD